jgi:hypothetical protein
MGWQYSLIINDLRFAEIDYVVVVLGDFAVFDNLFQIKKKSVSTLTEVSKLLQGTINILFVLLLKSGQFQKAK